MITDADNLDTDMLDTDVCIIGSGPAGLAIALELAGSSQRVVVLESGHRRGDRDAQALNASDSIRAGYNTIESRRRALGGSMTVWGGRWMTFEDIDFEERPWVPHSGWPFGRETLIPFYDRARSMFGTGFDEASAEQHRRRVAATLQLADHGLTARLVERSDAASFVAFSEQRLGSAGNVTILLGATALGVATSTKGDNVESVGFISHSGRKRVVRARVAVVAAGGIENARLLLESGITGDTGDGPVVGAFFMDHPYLELGPLEDGGLRPPPEFTVDGRAERERLNEHGMITMTDTGAREMKVVKAAAHFRVGPGFRHGPEYHAPGTLAVRELARYARRRELPPHAATLFSSIAGDLGAVAKTGLRSVTSLGRDTDAVSIRMLVEGSPVRSNRVVLGRSRDRLGMRRPAVHWKPAELDERSTREFVDVVTELLAEQGYGGLAGLPRAGWPGSVLRGNHHTGTTRMHTDPRHGVVDETCRVHGLRNLFVAGSSAFPTSGASNPTLTIAALAIRLADYLQEVD